MRDNISIPESIASIINNNNILSDRATESARVYCRLCNALSQRDIGELSVIIPSLLHIEVGLLRIELENIINNVETPDHEDLIERTCDRLLPEYAVPPEQMSSVLFLTIHGSKGLTKHTVVLPGLEDSWLPGQSIDEELHEKQRIYFVALTRATDQILITFPYNRARGDPLNYPAPGRSEPSRFVRYCNIQTRYHE
jgi:superfamily I DNA/RNA helicase